RGRRGSGARRRRRRARRPRFGFCLSLSLRRRTPPPRPFPRRESHPKAPRIHRTPALAPRFPPWTPWIHLLLLLSPSLRRLHPPHTSTAPLPPPWISPVRQRISNFFLGRQLSEAELVRARGDPVLSSQNPRSSRRRGLASGDARGLTHGDGVRLRRVRWQWVRERDPHGVPVPIHG
ncbi:hypothetical protein Zm00014a_039746, partial [Zea mays]